MGLCSTWHSLAQAKQSAQERRELGTRCPQGMLHQPPPGGAWGECRITRAANVQSLGEAPQQKGTRAGAALAGHSDPPAVQSATFHNKPRPCYGTEWTGLEK